MRIEYHILKLQNNFSQAETCSEWHSPGLTPTTTKKLEWHNK